MTDSIHAIGMVRISKTVVAPVVASEPEVKVKVARKKKEVAPVVEPEVKEEVAEVVEVSDKSSLVDQLTTEKAEAQKNFQQIINAVTALKSNLKNMDKLSARLMKTAEKTSKRKKSTGKLSGFEKPTLISDDLAVFFGREKGSRMARTEVSKNIHEYVTTNNLQNTTNRRIIKPDPKLQKLLAIDLAKEELTYFNLQKYLKRHFRKDEA